MNPFLTWPGRFALFSGLVFLLVGIATSTPIVVLLGEVQLVTLALGFLLVAPSALVLDRRRISIRVDPDQDGHLGTGHVVGDEVSMKLRVRNETDQPLHNLRVEPFAAEALEVDTDEVVTVVGAGEQSTSKLSATAARCGRWMLHGFDVEVTGPFGLVGSRDYLPGSHAFEFYPAAGKLRRRASLRARNAMVGQGLHVVSSMGQGTEIRQLRDWRSGDALRDVAWKASLRARKLVSREFEKEVTRQVYVALDVSSSMRGGGSPGRKLDWAIHYTVDLVSMLVENRDRVGLLTFDEKLYGHIAPGNAHSQLRRILHHLVGLNSIVDEDLTEPDDTEIERLAADYLLVQDRLDFRRGMPSGSKAVNRPLLEKWLRSVRSEVQESLDNPVLREGVVRAETSLIREFLRARGVSVPYRVEARLGMKERGLVEALEQVVKTARQPHTIVVVSDLCAVMNLESLARGVNLVRTEGHEIEFVVPFTPWFHTPQHDSPRLEVVRELFTSAEAEERSRIIHRLRAMSVNVHVVRPSDRTELAAVS